MSETAQAAPGQSVPRGGLPERDPLDRLVAALHALILCQENRSLIGMLAASRRDAAELADRLDNHEQQVSVYILRAIARVRSVGVDSNLCERVPQTFRRLSLTLPEDQVSH